MLKIKNLSKYFGETRVINDCNFEIEKNKITAIIGPNGSGKTTFLNIVSGIEKLDQGKVIFNNMHIVNNSINQISNLGISRVFQKTMLFQSLTVKDNLILAINNENTGFWKNIISSKNIINEKEKIVARVLKKFKIQNLEHSIVSKLSFGQKRLVELSRAIINPHHLLILDEPVAGINSKRKKEVEGILHEMKNNKTILLIEHDMNFVFELADNVIVFDAGRIIATGTPDEIVNNKTVIDAYLGSKI